MKKASPSTPLYYPVAVWKFVLLNALTGGVYILYWQYQCWWYLKRTDKAYAHIWPFWRAVFAPLWSIALLKHWDGGTLTANGVATALAYLFFNALAGLPDPYWLLSFISFVVFVPAVQNVNALNSATRLKSSKGYAWNRTNTVSLLVCWPWIGIWAFAILSSIGMFPSTQVTEGAKLWSWQTQFMEDEGWITADETIEYYYGTDLFSFKEAGSVITDQQVVSYEKRPGGRYDVDRVRLADLDLIETEPGHFFADTQVWLWARDGNDDSDALLWFSVEQNRDRLPVEFLERQIKRNQIRWKAQQPITDPSIQQEVETPGSQPGLEVEDNDFVPQ